MHPTSTLGAQSWLIGTLLMTMLPACFAARPADTKEAADGISADSAASMDVGAGSDADGATADVDGDAAVDAAAGPDGLADAAVDGQDAAPVDAQTDVEAAQDGADGLDAETGDVPADVSAVSDVGSDVQGEDVQPGPDAGPDAPDGAGDAQACVPASELCNGKDDDCDGLTDEAGAEESCVVVAACAKALCVAGACLDVPSATASGACSDNNACTTADVCTGGSCVGQLKVCKDGEPCTDDGCDVVKGCVFSPTSAPCSDGDLCTAADACKAGACVGGGAFPCLDNNPCTLDGCDKASGCTYLPGSGTCTDGDACTAGDACQGGVCVPGKAATCDDGNACTKDACDKGICTAPQIAGPCDDGDPCTLPGTCSQGKCVLVAKDCNDQDVCTADSCDKASGACKHAAVAGCGKAPCGSQGDCKAGKCDLVAHACVGCLVHGDCASGQVCKAGGCVPGVQCASTSQCKATLQVCDAVGGLCVDCLAESDCGPGKTCLAKACVQKTTCVSDTVCPLVCAKALGVCAECNVAADCAGKGWCAADHTCHAPVCLANACLGGSWFQCAADGSGFAAGKSCDDGNDCTADTCDAVKICAHSAVADGSACGGSTCKAGACKGVLQAAGGSTHACAVMLDGTVACWGDNTYGQLGDGTTVAHLTAQVVPGLTNATMVATGLFHTCALAGGEVWCWGLNDAGQLGNGKKGEAFGALTPQKVAGLALAKAIATAKRTTCAILTDGKVACWGANTAGEVGMGIAGQWNSSVANVLTPTAVVGAADIISLAGGDAFFCAVTGGGGVACWGSDSNGQIGDGVTDSSGDPKKYLVPVAKSVDGVSGAAGVACSAMAACIRKQDGTVWCWGYNGTGALGIGTKWTDGVLPTQVFGLPPASELAAGGGLLLARVGGQVWTWGSQSNGGLGNGAVLGGVSGPVQVTGLGDAVALASSRKAGACAIRKNGTLWCWGSNRGGALGQGTSQGESSYYVTQPGAAAIGKGADMLIADAGTRACARGADSSWQCWGNLSAPFDISTASSAAVPLAAPFLPGGAKSVGLMSNQGCMVKSDGTVWCWGSNGSGQLGNGTTSSNWTTTPVQVQAVSSATSVGVVNGSACALIAGGTVKCWGSNSATGQAATSGITTTALAVTAAPGTVALTARHYHVCALDDGGKVRCWGSDGALPNGTGGNTPPVEIGGGPWKAVSAGVDHSCAIKTDGKLWCWGANGASQIGDGSAGGAHPVTLVPGLTGVVAVTAGDRNTCAIDSVGAVWCWGHNEYGQLGLGNMLEVKTPTKLTKLTTKAAAISMGSQNTCALGQDGSVTCWGDNSSGAVGDGSAWSAVPVQVIGVP